MDTKKINEITTMLHKCVSERDEARKAQIKAEDHESHWQFRKNCKGIINGNIKRAETVERLHCADIEGNQSLLKHVEIELMICDYVANMETIVENLKTELKKQRREYEAASCVFNGARILS
jgi:hypothetical protein